MSENRPIAPVSDPDLASLLSQVKLAALLELNCHQWAIVQSFDADKQTVVVKMAVLRRVPDPTANPPAWIDLPYPVLADVPVFVNSGGAGRLTMPVAAGDLCLVLFNDRDMDGFWDTGAVASPPSPRAHDLSDGLALIGFRTKAAPIADYDPDRVELRLGDTRLRLGSKVNLENNATSLLSAVQDLITTLKNWVNTGGSTPNPTTVTNLTNNQTTFETLLE